MHDESYILAGGTMAAAADALVHEHCVHTAVGEVGDRIMHVHDAGMGPTVTP